MRWIRTKRTWIMSGAMLAVTVQALANESQPGGRSYQAIIDRNPFGLKDPAPPQVAPPVAPPPKKEIFLTGISALFSPKRAYIMIKDQQGNIERESLAENDERNGLKVLEINEANWSVRIRKPTGEEELLKFDTHKAPPPTQIAAAPTAQPGAGAVVRPQVGRPGAVIPPGGAAQTSAPAANRPGFQSVPTRNPNPAANQLRAIRSNTSPGGQSSYTPPNQYQPGQPQNPAAPSPPPLSPEEQVIMMEVQRLQNPNVPFPPSPGLDHHGAPPAPNFPSFPPGPQ